MIRLQVFDPPMCCSSGVCGPQVDPVLPRFSEDFNWLINQGVNAERYNLSQQPQAFAADPAVKAALAAEGMACLPLIIVDGAIVGKGRYPGREELSRFAGLAVASELIQLPVLASGNCKPGSGCC